LNVRLCLFACDEAQGLARRRRQALLPDHRTGRMHEPLQSDGAMLDWIAVPDFLAA
jgi:hypothetical protein